MIALLILDGWGIGGKKGNAILEARTPVMDRLLKDYPSTILKASGENVGLPRGQMGNSEVGHITIGAGRIIPQDIVVINKAIKNKEFFKNPVFLKVVDNVKKHNSNLHLIGLVSDGGVHSHINHLKSLIKLYSLSPIYKNSNLYIHAFLDGRDVSPKSAIKYLKEVENITNKIDGCEIATVMGRYYAMDRNKRWERVKKAYDAMVLGKGRIAGSAIDAVNRAYKLGESDEFVTPTVLTDNKKPKTTIKDGDSVIFFNFRSDRAREITQAFVDKNFDKFERKKVDTYFVCITHYDNEFKIPVAFPPVFPKNTLGQVLSLNKLKQLRIAEREKYAHVTFFFNGGIEKIYKGEDRIIIPSLKVATYDLKPKMSAFEITEEVIKKIKSAEYDVIILNYANADMVGHTGKMDAAIKAVETVDACVGRVIKAVLDKNGEVIVTADHGNAEKMIDAFGKPYTAHTTNPVPFVLVSERREYKNAKLRKGILADIAPTILELIGIEKPKEMTGKSLIKKKI